MMEKGKCVLCDSDAEIATIGALNNRYKYQCNNCGTFLVSDKMQQHIPFDYKESKHLLSGYAREMSENKKEIYFDEETIDSILSNPLIPQSPAEKLDKLLLWYFKKSDYFGKLLNVSGDCAICYAFNKNELIRIYEQAVDGRIFERYVKNIPLFTAAEANGLQKIYLSFSGHQYCKTLQSKRVQTHNAFIAMWFSEEVSKAYRDAIVPAIGECGFNPVRVDNVEHNNDITDEIIAGIKNSRFIVADLTGYRGGVYYEAGYAKGLDIAVIFTCRSDWMKDVPDSDGKIIQQGVHFDINHENIITWDKGNEEALHKRIVNRIKATIL